MKALVKTLVGDAWNVAVVAAVMLAEVALVDTGRAGTAAFAIPLLTLAGVAWLTRR
jgi:hypothetical protein